VIGAVLGAGFLKGEVAKWGIAGSALMAAGVIVVAFA